MEGSFCSRGVGTGRGRARSYSSSRAPRAGLRRVGRKGALRRVPHFPEVAMPLFDDASRRARSECIVVGTIVFILLSLSGGLSERAGAAWVGNRRNGGRFGAH